MTMADTSQCDNNEGLCVSIYKYERRSYIWNPFMAHEIITRRKTVNQT